MTKYDDTNQWHRAAEITQCARGVYLVEVDTGDEFSPHPVYWACATPAKARREARRRARGPIHWVDQNMNPGEWVFGYVLRKHYQARLHGYDPSLVIADELGQWTKPSLEDAFAALTSGGGALITTAGPIDEAVQEELV